MRFTGSVILISTVTHHLHIHTQTLDLRQITHISNCIGMTIGTRCRQTVRIILYTTPGGLTLCG